MKDNLISILKYKIEKLNMNEIKQQNEFVVIFADWITRLISVEYSRRNPFILGGVTVSKQYSSWYGFRYNVT